MSLRPQQEISTLPVLVITFPEDMADIKFQAPEVAGIERVRFQVPVQNFFNIDLKQVGKFPKQVYIGVA